jgi:spoIIIJ-associated protein
MSAKTKKTKKDSTASIKELAERLLSLVGSRAKVDVKEDTKNEATLITMQAEEDAGLLIGNRGRTLNDIQTILGMILKRRTGEWKRVVVDVSGWREKEEKRLSELARQTAERVRATGEPQALYNLSPSQRRTIHLALAEEKDIHTESHGEEEERYLLISLGK